MRSSEDDTATRSAEQSKCSTPQTFESELEQQLTATMGQDVKDASSEHHSPEVSTRSAPSSVRSITVKSNEDGRPQRNRRITKKL